jgi:hypothetical protein
MTDVRMVPVKGGRGISRFIEAPRAIYADDPMWVPPLWIERRLHLSRLNPFTHHGEWQGWVAYDGKTPVGRITAQIDRLHRERHGATGHFGMIEFTKDDAVLDALLAAAESWLRERGTERVTGPFGFSINQESGLLVDGFDTPPQIMMPHGRTWYGPMLESRGYRPAVDLFAYKSDLEFGFPPYVDKLLERNASRIRLRALDRSRLEAEVQLLTDLFNDAWSDNWGFVPFTIAEFKELAQSLKLLVPDDMVQIAEIDGEAAAFIAGLPDLNEVVKDIDGKLLPFGWRTLWKRLKGGGIRSGRIALMGLRKQFHNKRVGMAAMYMLIDKTRNEMKKLGMVASEQSWILESNQGMRGIVESFGSRAYKRYRIYEKVLGR